MKQYKCKVCYKIARPSLFKHMIKKHPKELFDNFFPEDAIKRKDTIEATYDQMVRLEKERKNNEV